ncbi:hypothetical protein [Actinoplanes sp. NPDC026619]|uniref:hypothetical protein n=1 Tax=Actinoplanes sp. NPDC026619 TaxID=3155798 RepID=UPI0033E8915C
MIVVDFDIAPLDTAVSPLWQPGPRVDLATVSEMDLRYEYFWSRIRFVINDHDLGDRWGNVPLLDFTASLELVLESINRSNSGKIDFTENSIAVSFVRSEDSVEIEATTEASSFTCSISDLTAAARAFIDKVAVALLESHPDIANNEFFRRLTHFAL